MSDWAITRVRRFEDAWVAIFEDPTGYNTSPIHALALQQRPDGTSRVLAARVATNGDVQVLDDPRPVTYMPREQIAEWLNLIERKQR
jgi:hypothetical protein